MVLQTHGGILPRLLIPRPAHAPSTLYAAPSPPSLRRPCSRDARIDPAAGAREDALHDDDDDDDVVDVDIGVSSRARARARAAVSH